MTAIQVEKRGNRFMGVVKNASKGYPKEAMSDWTKTKPERGSHMALRAVEADIPLMAVAWSPKADMPPSNSLTIYALIPLYSPLYSRTILERPRLNAVKWVLYRI
jgi:hypothetical protein